MFFLLDAGSSPDFARLVNSTATTSIESSTKLGRRLGVGKEAEVFALGDRVLKLYKAGVTKTSAFREAANLAIAELRGLPAPAVFAVEQVDDRWGIVMAHIEGPTFADAILRDPASGPDCLKAMAELQLNIHRQPGNGLPAIKARFFTNIGRANILGEARRRRLLDALAPMPDSDRFCHGDFHPWNVLGTAGAARVVDWLDACSGPPAADVCRSYVLMRHPAPDLAAAYLEIYEALSGCSRAEIFAWLPFIAAARLSEGVPDETDGLMEMADTIG